MGKLSKQEEKGNRGRHLRDAAVKKLVRTPGAAPKMEGKTPEELVHELQVHQIELEMQNEELKRAQLALEESRDKYVDLYDFAPVGYFTFTPGALIAEVNLTGAALLGVERQKLKNGRFRRFVAPEDLDRWDRHIVSVLQHREKQSCDLMLKREGGGTFHARFDSIRLDLLTEKVGVSGGTPMVRTAVSDITERKKAEQIIEEARAYAESIVETMREPLIVLDTDLKVISANRSFCQTFKVNHKEIQGRFIYDLGNREWDIPKLRQLLKEVCLKNRVFDNYEIEHNFETIGPKTMLFNARRLATMQMILLTIDDITDYRLMEVELSRLKEKQYRTLIENLPQKVFLKDTNSVYICCNQNFAADLKIKPEEIVGKTDYDFFPKDLADKYRADDLRIMTAGKTEEIEENYIQDGKEAFVHVLKACLRDDKNNTIGLFGLFWDITERKQMEDNLRESEEKFRAIFDNALDGILLADAEKRKFYMGNNAICRMLGYSQEEIKNLGVVDIHPEKDLHYAMYQYEKQANGEFRLPGDLPLKRKDGNIFYADIYTTTIKIAGKKSQIVFFHDVTELKLAEEERRRASELKAATEIKSKFTSMVSHELRSPLAAIKEGINIVLEGLVGNVNNEQKDLLNTAKRNADRLGRLINNVLDFQKIESGKMEFDIRENDINEVAREVGKAMSLLAEQKGLDLVVDVDDGLPKIRFSRDKIIQVLTNLLSNAIKFTEKGSISMSTKQEDNLVHVIVQDTGVGIKAKDMPRLFQAFEQLDSIRDKKKGGTGLGLAISKEIILAHKGKIWAESEAGKGSAFHFVLPIKERRG